MCDMHTFIGMVHTYIYIHSFYYVHMYVYVCKCVHMYVRTCTYIHTYIWSKVYGKAGMQRIIMVGWVCSVPTRLPILIRPTSQSAKPYHYLVTYSARLRLLSSTAIPFLFYLPYPPTLVGRRYHKLPKRTRTDHNWTGTDSRKYRNVLKWVPKPKEADFKGKGQ